MNYINSRKKFKTINSNGILEVIDTKDKLSIIRKADSILNEAEENCEILFLYRGENKNVFYKKTGCKYIPDVNIGPYFDLFFIIGSKAKSYFERQVKIIKPIKQFEHNKKTEYVFQKLHELSNNIKFLKDLTFFNDHKNKEKFEFNISKITDDNDKLSILNFYIAYIHTISSNPIDMKAYSVMISATKKFKIAKIFSDNGYIIGFWLKKTIINQAIDYQNLNDYRLLIAKYNLPMIDTVNSPENYEVTIFSAVFPHNILYVYDIEKQTYIINPYLFDTKLESLISSGINVDQTYFDEFIKGIYERSICRCDTELQFENEM